MRRAVAIGVSMPTSAARRPIIITIATSRKSLPIASVMRSRAERDLRAKVRWNVKANGARRWASASSTTHRSVAAAAFAARAR
jgi:hypothetical protein